MYWGAKFSDYSPVENKKSIVTVSWLSILFLNYSPPITVFTRILRSHGEDVTLYPVIEAEESVSYGEGVTIKALVSPSRTDEIIMELGYVVNDYVGYARVKIWVVDKPGFAGKQIRNKLRQEVNRVVREKRTKPHETNYNYSGVGAESVSHRAYYAESASELAPDAPEWTEFSAADYEKLWQSDDTRFSYSQSEAGKYSLLLFRIKIESNQKTVKKIVLKFEGYGTAPAGNGVTVKAWNSEASAWQSPQTGSGGGDEELTLTLESSLTDFIDSDGYVYLLARTTNVSNGVSSAVIHCDYVDCLVTVEGITYVDMVSYRDEDEVRVKPFIWRTEFTVKTWLFENVTVT